MGDLERAHANTARATIQAQALAGQVEELQHQLDQTRQARHARTGLDAEFIAKALWMMGFYPREDTLDYLTGATTWEPGAAKTLEAAWDRDRDIHVAKVEAVLFVHGEPDTRSGGQISG